MEQKLDEIINTLTDMRVVQAEQKQILEEHTRRSAANEEAVARLTELVVVTKQGFEGQIRPIQKHVDRVQFLFAIVVGAGAIAGAVQTIIAALRGS